MIQYGSRYARSANPRYDFEHRLHRRARRLRHLPDRFGTRVALVCVLIEAAGQALIWLAPWSTLALFGAGLAGFGYSLVYPGFGVEAVRRVPPENRGLAM